MVQGKRLNHLGAEIAAGNFAIVSGISKDKGGDDDGPNPHQLVEAALAACTILTLQMYAERKNLKLESANVTVNIQSESKSASVFSRKIELIGDLAPDERARLMEIADKCPIHILFSSQITIKSELV